MDDTNRGAAALVPGIGGLRLTGWRKAHSVRGGAERETQYAE